MSRIKAGDIELGYREWGDGPVAVLFVHGNLASKDWLELAARWFPKDLRVIGIDWRGCGDSDRPAPKANYENYSMPQHATDMIAALDTLGIDKCHLATHSTGGIISSYMLLRQPERFGKVLALDPVTPLGLKFDEQGVAILKAMQNSRDVTHAAMAAAASSLFSVDTLVPGSRPQFREGLGELKTMFEKIVDQTCGVADGVWMGTPKNLTREFETGTLGKRMGEIAHETLTLWGEHDFLIPKADLEVMAAAMPNCRLITVPGVGHSMNIEQPQMYAGYFGAFLSATVP